MAQEGYSDAASYVIRSFTRPGFTLTYPPSFLPSRTSRFGVKRICPRDLAFRAIAPETYATTPYPSSKFVNPRVARYLKRAK